MATPFPSVRILAAVGVTLISTAAFAQFGQLFGPPRPPADVPSRPSAPAPLGAPQMPPEEMDEDQPPPARAPAGRPQPGAAMQQPGTVPSPGIVRSQPLPPPPGATAAPPPQQGALPPGATAPPVQQTATGQPGPRGTPQPANVAPQPGDEVITEMPTQKIANPTAIFTGLDKVTGRIITFDVALNETVQFGALQVTPRVCYTRPPTESANTDSFVEVDEVTLQGEVKRIFTGWMFASSPGLHAVEHPIYDVWLTSCKGGTSVVADAPAAPATGPAPRTPTRGDRAVQQPTLQQPNPAPRR